MTRGLLDEAEGDSQLVVAAFVDIRDFSAFNEKVESVQSAAYIRRVYQRVLDEYLPGSDFFKLTGDGLMLIYELPFDLTAADVARVSGAAIEGSLRLVERFGTLVQGDPVVTFDVPQRVGVGIARGAACRLRAGDTTLDYAGRVLNLAARLMDIARPEGVVVVDPFAVEQLSAETKAKFSPLKVYLSGVAPHEGVDAHVTTSPKTVVPPRNLSPLDEPVWRDAAEPILRTVGNIRDVAQTFRAPLEAAPIDNTLECTIDHPKVTAGGERHATLWTAHHGVPVNYYPLGSNHYCFINLEEFRERLCTHLPADANDWPVKVHIRYRIK